MANKSNGVKGGEQTRQKGISTTSNIPQVLNPLVSHHGDPGSIAGVDTGDDLMICGQEVGQVGFLWVVVFLLIV